MEKRRHERIGFHADAVITCKDIRITGQVTNISLKGMFITTTGRLPLNASADVTLFFKGASDTLTFSIPAVVVRTDSNGMGFRFEKIDMKSVLLQLGTKQGKHSPLIAREYLSLISAR